MVIKQFTIIFTFVATAVLLGFPVAIAAYRFQLLDMGTAFTIIIITASASLVLLLLTLVLAVLAFLKNQKTSAINFSLIVVLLAIPVTGLLMQVIKAKSLPFLHQVSTDTVNLPQFQVIVELRGEGSNPLAYDSAKLAPLQQAAYPELQTIISELNANQAFIKAVEIADHMGWYIVNKNAEQGIIEAVDTTLVWAFKDDVVIRIQSTKAGSNIDLRSISRVGGSDLGANANRIKRFITMFVSN